jgi:dipeptidyl aminopeptidase/acylaminoacyl peptidase
MKTLLTLLLAGLFLCTSIFAQKTHPFSVLDMLVMKRISEPAVSPDGKRIVFTLRTTDLDQNRGATDLWMVQIDGQGLRRLTSHPAGDHNPCWTPDGKAILFLSDRSGSSQVWRIPVDGGEAAQVSALPLDVGNLVLAPSGQIMAFSLDVFPELETIADTKKRLDAEATRKSSGMLYDRVFVRHWDTWKDGRRSHIFVMPLDGKGKPVDVMGSLDADCPSKPFGGRDDFTFTPDSQAIVLTARNVGRREPWSTDFDLYLAPVDGSRQPTCLTESNEAWDCCPTFSPDGKTLAHLAMRRPGYESDRFRIALRSWPAGPQRVLTESWDRSPGALCWSPGGDAIFATAANLGQRSLFAVDAGSGEARVVVRNGSISSPVAAGERLIYGMNHLQSPTELWSAKLDGSDASPVTQINKQEVAAARMGDFEQFTFGGFNGDTVYGYVVKPADFSPGRKYPVAFLIHGGPQGSFGNMFHYRWNPQAYAGAGYAAVMIDFHGSVGYGQEFTDSIRGDWGGKPLEDLQKGLQAALERYPWLDGDRVGALGASFGGYMINWIAGNWPNRFRCLVNHDGNLDERMAYYNTEELWFPEWDHEGTPWSNPQGYEKHNPVNYVQRWKTPMLVIHGARDYRVVDTQGLGTFNALQRRGIPSQLLYFPDENHWVLKPHNSILWHKTVIQWLDRWVKK